MSHISYPRNCVRSQSSTEDECFKSAEQLLPAQFDSALCTYHPHGGGKQHADIALLHASQAEFGKKKLLLGQCLTQPQPSNEQCGAASFGEGKDREKRGLKKEKKNFPTAHHAWCSCLPCGGSRSAITAPKREVFLLLVHLLNKQSGFHMITLALAFSFVCPFCLFLPKPFRPDGKDSPLPPPRITAYSHFPAICF